MNKNNITPAIISSTIRIIIPIIIYLFQLLSIAGIAVSLKKPKPNYDWEELKEYEFFEILSLGEDFIESPEKKNMYGWMIVHVNPSFGPTLVFFPTSNIIWNNQKPEIGASYMRVRERLIKLS